MMKKILLAFSCWLVLGLAPQALAQETDPAKLFDQAEAYYNVGDWEMALKNYKEAYILSKEPALLFNMAQCYRQMNKYDDAIRTYKNFLKEVPETPLRPTVEGFMKDMEAKKASAGAVTPTTQPNLKPDPIVAPTSRALTPESPEEKPSSNKKIFLYAGIGGGVVLTGVILGALLSNQSEEPNTNLGTFTPFEL